MTDPPRPYLTHTVRRRWAGWFWGLGLVILLVVGTSPRAPWNRILVCLVGLGFLIEGIDAMRTGSVRFRFSVWYGFEAERAARPVRFWIYAISNLVLGGWVMFQVARITASSL